MLAQCFWVMDVAIRQQILGPCATASVFCKTGPSSEAESYGRQFPRLATHLPFIPMWHGALTAPWPGPDLKFFHFLSFMSHSTWSEKHIWATSKKSFVITKLSVPSSIIVKLVGDWLTKTSEQSFKFQWTFQLIFRFFFLRPQWFAVLTSDQQRETPIRLWKLTYLRNLSSSPCK